jgi:hypothetical protein
MTEYTAAEVRELVAELPVLKIEAGADASEVEALRDALEGADQLLRELPEGERAEALVDDSLLVGRVVGARGAELPPVGGALALGRGWALLRRQG